MGTGKQRTALIAGVALLSAGNAASAQTVKDAGGNTYNTVAIGTQVWTKENLNYKVAGSFYYKDDSVANAATYGRVYTQFAAKTACPTAWHLPSLAEWTTLADFLGGSATAGGKMKSAGTANWTPTNTGGDNSSGFSALAGGSYTLGVYAEMGTSTRFWASNDVSTTNGMKMQLDGGSTALTNISTNKASYLYVRCVSDAPAALHGKDSGKGALISAGPSPDHSFVVTAGQGYSVVEIHSVQGRLMKTVAIKSEGGMVDLKEMQNGLYFITVKGSAGSVARKFLKR